MELKYRKAIKMLIATESSYNRSALRAEYWLQGV
jgi:hypothetical protein